MGFKDLMKSFLYENVEDDDDEEEEEELSSSTPTKPAAQPEAAKPAQPAAASAAAQTAAPAAQTPSAAQPVQSAPAEQQLPENLEAYYTQPKVTAPAASSASQGSFLNRIDTDLSEPEPARQKRTGISRIHTARASARSQMPRQNYATVISPIFGNLPDAEKNPSALHDAINLPKPADTFEMVEIISPMFGTAPTHVQEISKQMTPVAQAPDTPQQAEAASKSKKAAPSKAGQPAADDQQSSASSPEPELALPAPAEASEDKETESGQPSAPQKTAPRKQNADLSAYLSRGPNPKSAGKSAKTYSKSKKGGRSR